MLTDGDWILSQHLKTGNDVRLLQLADVGVMRFLDKSQKFISKTTAQELGVTYLKEGDVLISRMAHPLARACLLPSLPKPSITAVDVAIARCDQTVALPQYLMYLCNSLYVQNRVESVAVGTTRKRISRKNLEQIKVPLPPLPEQRRIVAKLEEFLDKVNACQKRLDRIPIILKRFRQSVLAAACSGRLTEDWREGNPKTGSGNDLFDRIRQFLAAQPLKSKELEHIEAAVHRDSVVDALGLDDIPEAWAPCDIGKIGRVCNGSTPSRKAPEYWGGDVPWVSSGEVKNNIITNTRELVSHRGLDETSLRLLPQGTVLIAMIGEGKTRGQSAVLEIEATINQNIAAILVDHGLVKSRYLWLWFRYQYSRTREVGSGSGPQALNCERVRELPFLLPGLSEQSEIVRRVEALFMLADQIEARYTTAKESVDQLNQSVLAQAFRGELVPQDPKDEPAIKLLERIASKQGCAERPIAKGIPA